MKVWGVVFVVAVVGCSGSAAAIGASDAPDAQPQTSAADASDATALHPSIFAMRIDTGEAGEADDPCVPIEPTDAGEEANSQPSPNLDDCATVCGGRFPFEYGGTPPTAAIKIGNTGQYCAATSVCTHDHANDDRCLYHVDGGRYFSWACPSGVDGDAGAVSFPRESCDYDSTSFGDDFYCCPFVTP